MTCIQIADNIIVCVNDWGRLKVGNKYVWVDMHPYCGPSFFTDRKMDNIYDPTDESDPIWPVFEVWHEKKKRQKEKRMRR